MIINVKDKEISFEGYVFPINSVQRVAERCYEQGKADAIEEYRKEMHDMIEGDEEFTDWQKYEILQCNELVAEQLKEQNK